MASLTKRGWARSVPVTDVREGAREPGPGIRRKRGLPGLLAIAGGLVIWEGLAWLNPPQVLPGPGAVAARLWTLATSGVLWPHVGVTLTEAGLGFLLAALGGLFLGYVAAQSPLIEQFLAPYISGTQAVPVVAVAPLLLLWFGFGLLPKVLTCAVIVFFPIVVNTVIGLRGVDRDLRQAAESFGAGRWQLLWYVELPLALRTLLGGLQLGLTLALTGAVVGEFLASDSGLGYLLTFGRSNYDTTLVFAALVALATLSIVGYSTVGLIARRVIDWE